MEKELTKKQIWWKNWYEKNKEEYLEKRKAYTKEYRKKHNEELTVKKKSYRKTKTGRASYLRDGYILQDKRYNKGQCTLTTNDILEMFDNGCYWCGEKDWHKLGADRIDNSKPHTKENCVCSCLSCNIKRAAKEHSKSVLQYTLNGEFVAEYNSTNEASKATDINQGNISLCCLGKRKSAGGYVWQFVA